VHCSNSCMAQASLSTGPGLTFSMQSCVSAVKTVFMDKYSNEWHLVKPQA
jgi:hypothetical protein